MRAALALCLLGLPLACTRADGQPRVGSEPASGIPPAADVGRSAAAGPVVLELFTSQGCSSCPAAEQLLGKLASAGSVGDRALAPLAFHVDYWNDLGWADPYSLPAWTERQHQYSRSLGDHRVYTPELVVGGAAGLIGSNGPAVIAAIERAARPALLAATAAWTPEAVTVTATAPSAGEVWVAVWEDGAPTKVTRGENSGETLRGDRVVRRLERVAAAGAQASTTIKLDPSWRAGGAVAFAHAADRRIVASVLLPVTAAQRK